jgi:hypothetical protein
MKDPVSNMNSKVESSKEIVSDPPKDSDPVFINGTTGAATGEVIPSSLIPTTLQATMNPPVDTRVAISNWINNENQVATAFEMIEKVILFSVMVVSFVICFATIVVFNSVTPASAWGPSIILFFWHVGLFSLVITYCYLRFGGAHGK